MSKEYNSQQSLLDVDLDSVVAKGKGESKRNGVILIVIAIGLILIGFFRYQHNVAVKLESSYQEALSAQKAGEYETAIALFQELEDYKDSRIQLEETQFAHEFVTSDIFMSFKQMMYDSFAATDGHEINIQYDPGNRTVVVSDVMPKETEDEYHFEEMSPAALGTWGTVCNNVNETTRNSEIGLSAGGYPSVSCTFIIRGHKGETLCVSTNGETVENCIDMEKAVAATYDELYSNVVSLVDEGKYQEAYEYWNSNNESDFFDLEYKDLSDYYHYAAALRNYIGQETISLSTLYAALKELNAVSLSFKETQKYRDEIINFKNVSVAEGLFIKTISSTMQCRIDIISDWISIYYYLPSSGDKLKIMPLQSIAWTVSGGEVASAEVKYGARTFTITSISGGVKAEVYVNGEWDSKLSGTYIKE